MKKILLNLLLNALFLSSCFNNNFSRISKTNNEEQTAYDILNIGLYPQSRVNDEFLISSLNQLNSSCIDNKNGWYFYNGTYYAKKIANPYDSTSKFDDGTQIEKGKSYWFKCEPIKWNIINNDNGLYSLESVLLLDVHRYNYKYLPQDGEPYSNNYKHSEIRNWLNTKFYQSVFALENNKVQTTMVDNNIRNNKFACENTNDKVYLPSLKDYYPSPRNTQHKTTEWARANYALVDNSNNGRFWTRSPSDANDYGFGVVGLWGPSQSHIYDFSVDCGYICIRPCISIINN